jgi:hypothetical protein
VPDALRSRYLDLLFKQVSDSRYPSITMLERVEQAITDHERATEYVNLLLDTMEQDSYPSPTMLDRVRGLIDAIDRSPQANGRGDGNSNGT